MTETTETPKTGAERRPSRPHHHEETLKGPPMRLFLFSLLFLAFLAGCSSGVSSQAKSDAEDFANDLEDNQLALNPASVIEGSYALEAIDLDFHNEEHDDLTMDDFDGLIGVMTLTATGAFTADYIVTIIVNGESSTTDGEMTFRSDGTIEDYNDATGETVVYAYSFRDGRLTTIRTITDSDTLPPFTETDVWERTEAAAPAGIN